jgi:hypothetical protein
MNLWNESSLVEDKSHITWHVLKMQSISLLPKYVTWLSREVFLRDFAFGSAGILRLKHGDFKNVWCKPVLMQSRPLNL